MTFFASLLITGLMTGAIYALVALGFVLVYKATGVINFAQGEFMMFGAFVAAALLTGWGLPAFVGIPITMVVMAGLGLITERVVLRPMIGRPVIGMIMATVGLAFVFRGLAPMLWGGTTKDLVLPLPQSPVQILDVRLSPTVLAGAAAAVLLVGGFALLFQRSRTGIALRAVADDQQAAMAMGISVPWAFGTAMAVAGVAAAAGGLIWGDLLGVDSYLALVGFKVFPVVILGGLDSVEGAVVGGLVVGAVESVAAGYIDPLVGGGTKDFIPFLLMLVVLMVRPYGFFGKEVIERV
ncbi:MAG TPA: branched-chain amino acid ABC transporter permease [Acidimicrobiia bacterium]|nr:branched-chain amino acid ABC transporter permease [Acidimicrobiia bacterium]